MSDPSANLGLPGSSLVCLYSIGKAGGEDTINRLAGYFEAKGYDVATKLDATVADLANIPKNCAIFYFNTHGVYTKDKNGKAVWIALETGTKKDAYPNLQSDFDAGLVTWTDTNIAIMSEFIRRNWHFPDNCLVFINGCEVAFDTTLGKDSIHDIIVNECNATLLGGWTGGNTANCESHNLYLFDRLLGTNAYQDIQENPPQRPFDLNAITARMSELGYDTENVIDPGKPTSVTKLQFERRGLGDLGTLAPSIRRMQVDEIKKTLTIKGLFGTDQSALKVIVMEQQFPKQIAGFELSFNPSQDAGTIVCNDLPVTGKGSGGYVVVARDYGNGRLVPSNPVPLTAWHGKFTYTLSKPGGGADAAVGTITWQPFLRGDVHDFRDKPHGPIVAWPKPIFMANDAANPGHYTCGGTYCGGNYSLEWQGEGDLPPGAAGMTVLGTWGGIAVLGSQDQSHPTLTVNLLASTAQITLTEKTGGSVCLPASLGTEAHFSTRLGQQGSTDILQGKVQWGRDQGYDIAGDCTSVQAPVPYMHPDDPTLFTVKLKWDSMSATYPPDKDTPA